MNQNPHIIQHEIEEVVSVVPQDPRVQAHGQLPDGRVHTVHRVQTVHHILRVHRVSLHQQECEQRAEEGQQGSHHQGGCAVSCARVHHLPVVSSPRWCCHSTGEWTRHRLDLDTVRHLDTFYTHACMHSVCDTRLIGASDYF